MIMKPTLISFLSDVRTTVTKEMCMNSIFEIEKIRQNTIDYSFAGWRVIGTLAWIGYVAGDCIQTEDQF